MCGKGGQKFAHACSSYDLVSHASTAEHGGSSTTFDVEERDHVAELFDMFGQVRLAGDVFQAFQTGAGEACGDARKLMDSTQVGKSLAGQPKAGNVLGLVWIWLRGELEALLGQVGAPLGPYGLLRVYMVQYLT